MINKMIKGKIVFFLIFLVYPLFSYSHVNHYSNLKFIEMDILRNGKKVGFNKYTFKNQNDLLIVKNKMNFVVKLVEVNLITSTIYKLFI